METLLQLRPIGNSQGVVLPKRLLAKIGAQEGATFTVEVAGGALVIKPVSEKRQGWAQAAQAIAAAGGDVLELGDFDNEADGGQEW